jgi:hypothetical protein
MNNNLTKDNLTKRGWIGDETCRFCCCKETIDHLFFGCTVAIYIWDAAACDFNQYNIPPSMESIFTWVMSAKSKKDQILLAAGICLLCCG